MKQLRGAAFGVTLLLCASGYLASQFAFFNGSTAQYIKALDESPVPLLALILLALLVLLAFLPHKEEP